MLWEQLLPQIFFIGQILFAAILGVFLGWHRVSKGKAPSGRTYALVTVGSCLFTIISYNGFAEGDPIRVAAQVVVGVGFLGAGAILRREGTILGLTTAAGLWISAAIGMAVGVRMYLLALVSALIVFILFTIIDDTKIFRLKR